MGAMITHSENMRLRTLFLTVGLSLLVLAIAGCGLTPQHAPRASNQWSNGKLVGTTLLNNQVAFQIDDAGHSFMVWVGLEHELHFAHLDERAKVVVEKPLDLRTHSPQKPQLLLDPSGGLHLTWLDREEENPQLFYARLSTDGQVIQGATVLSLPEQRVAHSSMALDPVGRTIQVFWSDNSVTRPGCYHAALDGSGAIAVAAETLIADGMWPVAQADRQGFIHLAWRVEGDLDREEKTRFRYAVYDPQRRALGPDIVAGEPLALASMFGGAVTNAKFSGPWLGLDERSVYLAWMLEVRERGEYVAFTFYRAFPQPVLAQRGSAGSFDYPLPEVTGEAVHVRGVDPTMTGHPQFLAGQPARQVLSCFTLVQGPGNLETLQIAVMDAQPGQVAGQEIVSASRGASLRPNVAITPDGYLHLVWIDTSGFERYQVVYASTSPQAKAALNRITAYEVVDRILSTAMSAVSALFFIPMVLGWMFVPVLWLIIFTWTTHESEVSDPHGPIGLGVAMLLQLAVKLFLFPSLLTRLSFPPLFSPLLSDLLGRWILPLLLAALSAGVVWAYRKRTRNQSILMAYLIYAVADSLLTLIIYVTLPMG